MKKLLIKLLGVAYLILLAGIALVGSHFYFNNKAANGGGIPAEAELKVVSGKVIEGSEVTLQTKRRRGVDSTEKFYELVVQPDAGSQTLKLRLAHDIPKTSVESTLQENITAKYDDSDENITYDIKIGNNTVVSYAERAAKAQATADKQASFFGDGAMLKAGIWWVIIGAALLFWRNRLQRGLANQAPNSSPVQTEQDSSQS